MTNIIKLGCPDDDIGCAILTFCCYHSFLWPALAIIHTHTKKTYLSAPSLSYMRIIRTLSSLLLTFSCRDSSGWKWTWASTAPPRASRPRGRRLPGWTSLPPGHGWHFDEAFRDILKSHPSTALTSEEKETWDFDISSILINEIEDHPLLW